MIGLPWYGWVGLAVILLGGLAYWLLVLSEGAYFGSRFVCMLYDWTARQYEGIKGFDPFYERRFVGEPLAVALAGRRHPLVLDVAAGTGRTPRALLPEMPSFDGLIVELDRARRMLQEGCVLLADSDAPTVPVQADGLHLPFADNTFDAAVSLEALEFFPDLGAALEEMVRVLRPGGFLMITNRKGGARYYMPGRVRDVGDVIALLGELGVPGARSSVWQVNYDLVVGVKAVST